MWKGIVFSILFISICNYMISVIYLKDIVKYILIKNCIWVLNDFVNL